MLQHDGRSRSTRKPKRKLLAVRIVISTIALLELNACHAFSPQSPIQQQPRPQNQYINVNVNSNINIDSDESFRWQLQSKRQVRENYETDTDTYTDTVTDRDTKTDTAHYLVGRIPAVIASTAAAVWLFFGASSNVATAASSDVPEYEYISISERDIQIQANKKLVDYAVGTVNTQFYDSSGGARFNPSDFYRQWRDVQSSLSGNSNSGRTLPLQELGLDTRDGTVETLKYLISTLKDPYSKYMTREELQYELRGSHDGFLGTGAYIEVPKTPEGPSQLSASASTSASASALSYSTSSSSSSSLPIPTTSFAAKAEQKSNFQANIARERLQKKKSSEKTKQLLLTNTKVSNLPVVTAVAPNSPAERAGLVVGDKIVGVGDKDNFLGYGKDEIRKCLGEKWGYSDSTTTKRLASNKKKKDNKEATSRYFGIADLTIAKPVYTTAYSTEEATMVARAVNTASPLQNDVAPSEIVPNKSSTRNREIVLGYRSTKVKLPTIATDPSLKAIARARSSSSSSSNRNQNLRGDAVVQYELLSPSSTGFGSSSMIPGPSSIDGVTPGDSDKKVGYIRLTRFSKSSTAGYLNAVKTLEEEGAQSYVIDLRNNYGGVIQEAMLTASTMLGDQHALLCYLLNARGGFTPVDVESYVVDPRYPGYLLSKADKSFVLEQTMKENPKMFQTVLVGDGDRRNSISDDLLPKGSSNSNKRLVANWDPPSSYASIHEQVTKRGIRRMTYASLESSSDGNAYGAPPYFAGKKSTDALLYRQRMQQLKMQQKDIVLLINEGTASSAEFFAAALQDNDRSLAVVGTKSFGKGIIQHTFPMPDGGGLQLTIGEFLRPSLKHVTNPFGVAFVDKNSGEIVGGGGVNPDVYCESRQGIPGRPSADLCVKVALDVLEEHRYSGGGGGATTNIIAEGERSL